MKKIAFASEISLIIFSILFLIGNYCQAEINKYRNEPEIGNFTDSPVDLTKESKQIEGFVKDKVPNNDLQKVLSMHFPQRNEIERAICAVVEVKSSIGSGSGFFITDNGYIITNKHVLKGNENERKTAQSLINSLEEEMNRINSDLNKEEEQLDNLREKLERDKDFIDSQPESAAKRHNIEQYEYYLERYEQWENDFKERKEQFRAKEMEIEEKISDYYYHEAKADKSLYFKILIADDTELNVYLVATSRDYDLALLKLDGYKTPFLKPADSKKIKYGETVYAIGNPVELRNSVAKGIVSGFESNFIKTDVKIYPGNSGGPLIIEDGRVIGVNSFKELTIKYEGLGFAISIETAINEFRLELGDIVKIEYTPSPRRQRSEN